MSTGMASEAEVTDAVAATKGCGGLVLLHCVSAYPTEIGTANVR